MPSVLRIVLILVALAVLLTIAGETTDDGVAALAGFVALLILFRVRDAGRIKTLTEQVNALRRQLASAPVPLEGGLVPAESAPGREPAEASEGAVPRLPRGGERPASSGRPPRPRRRPRPPAEPRKRPSRPLWSLDRLPPEARRAWAFVTGGNLLARVGFLVLFVGIGLAVRQFASSGAQLLLVAAFGGALAGLGWRLRNGTPGFGLTLQGGGIAILYLTVYAAYALYGLIPSLPAIALMALVAAMCGGLALVQNAPALALLGVAGGFVAPVLVGSDSGNHVLLFSYYSALNLGVLGIASTKGWRSVAVLGFVSTFVTGGLWGGLQYRPALYASVQPFVAISFAIYLTLAVRFAVRSARQSAEERALAVDGALVFGLPAATFLLQAGLIEGVVPYGRAWSAALLSVVYLVGFGLLRRRERLGLLSDAFLAVGLAFATLALPLAFERVVAGAMWVLEGAGLVWVGARQRKAWMRWAGLTLQSVAALVLFGEGVLAPSSRFTPDTLTGWIVAVGLGLSALVLHRRHPGGSAEDSAPSSIAPASETAPLASEEATPADDDARWWPSAAWERTASTLMLLFALFWWTVTAGVHALELTPDRYEPAALLAAAAVSAALFLGLGRSLRWKPLEAASLGLTPVAWLLALAVLVFETDPVGDLRGVAWIAVFGVIGVSLWQVAHRFRSPMLVLAGWLLAFVVANGLGARVGTAANEAWAAAAIGAVLAVSLGLSARLPEPWAGARERRRLSTGFVVAVSTWLVASWSLTGDADPLRTIPLLNPVDGTAVASLLALVGARAAAAERSRTVLSVLLGGLGLATLTVAVARGVWAIEGVPWTVDALYASSSFQAALAVAWTLLALGLAVVAVRRGSRGLWFFGAGVLALVVAKLFLVDLSQAEALVRIVAFLMVGTLVLLIGYRAPLPPAPGAEAPEEPSPAEPEPPETEPTEPVATLPDP